MSDKPIIEVRFRFKKLSKETPEHIMDRAKTLLKENEKEVTGVVSHNHIVIGIPKKKSHFWSPQLTLNLETTAEGTELRGLYGPKPDVWLMFMFIYFFLGFATIVVSVVGLSRYNLGLSSYILWAIPIVIGGFIALYVSSKTGQKLGHDETMMIHSLVKPNLLLNSKEIED